MHPIGDNKHTLREWRMEIATGNLVCIYVAAITRTLNHAVPNGSGTCDTYYISSERRIVRVTCPDAHHHIRRIANGPVVLKVICCAGLGSYLVDLPIGLLPIIKRKCMDVPEFRSTCRLIREY